MRRRAKRLLAAESDPAWVLCAPEEPPATRRRRGDRRPVAAEVRVTERDLAISFEAFDLSGNGVFLRSELLFSPGDQLRLEIARDPGARVTIGGEVIDVVAENEPERGSVGAGVLVEFRDVSLRDLETLVSLAAI